jgi:uncharacterized membrane protein
MPRLVYIAAFVTELLDLPPLRFNPVISLSWQLLARATDTEGTMDQLTVVVFHDEMTAKQAAQALKDLCTGRRATLNGISVLSKDHQGKLAVGETVHEGTRGAAVAALIGALAGGVAGGPLAAGLFAAGGAVFGLSADLIHRSSNTEMINRVSHELSPGKAAVIAHLSDVKDVDISAMMQELGGKMIE